MIKPTIATTTLSSTPIALSKNLILVSENPFWARDSLGRREPSNEFIRKSDRMSNRPRTIWHYFNPACASISRNCLRVRMSIDCATRFPLRS